MERRQFITTASLGAVALALPAEVSAKEGVSLFNLTAPVEQWSQLLSQWQRIKDLLTPDTGVCFQWFGPWKALDVPVRSEAGWASAFNDEEREGSGPYAAFVSYPEVNLRANLLPIGEALVPGFDFNGVMPLMYNCVRWLNREVPSWTNSEAFALKEVSLLFWISESTYARVLETGVRPNRGHDEGREGYCSVFKRLQYAEKRANESERFDTIQELQDRARELQREGYTVLRSVDTNNQTSEPVWTGYSAFHTEKKWLPDRELTFSEKADLRGVDPSAIYRKC
jgi:hypothetical protein